MKRLIAVLLIFVMLFTLLPAGAFAAENTIDRSPLRQNAEPMQERSRTAFAQRSAILQERSEDLDYEELQRGVDYALAHGCEITEPDAQEQSPAVRTPVRANLEDNLAMPGPLMDGVNAAMGHSFPLYLIRYQTGKPNQYQTVLIYKGKGTNGEPVASFFDAFSPWEGIGEWKGDWYTDDATLGTHTLVTCTTELIGGRYYVVDNTAFAQTFQVVRNPIPATGYYLADENGKRVDKIVLDGTEPGYYQVMHTPATVTYTSDLDIESYLDYLGPVREYNGLVIATPEKFGWTQIALRFWNYSEIYVIVDMEVCTNPRGHRTEKTVLREPCTAWEGAEMRYCPDCCASWIDPTTCFETVFYHIKDVPENEWFYEYVSTAVRRGLFNGVSTHSFQPNGSMTRAMLVTVLWRYAGSPKDGSNTFSDVKAGQWYTDAVAWAAKNHIVDGVGGGKFDPNGMITREQMAAILYRYAVSNEIDTSARAELGGFAGSAKVSSWAKDAMKWCVAEGFIGGTKVNGTLLLDPQGSATRAQVCAILMRFINKVDPAEQVETLDTTGAEASGTLEDDYFGNTDWAFFPDGTLVLAGDATVPGQPAGAAEKPWAVYQDRITSIRFLNGITAVGRNVFKGYSKLESVEFPDSLSQIYIDAFSDCTALKTVRWPESDLKIDTYAFSGCTSLVEFSPPKGIRSIDEHAFSNCTGLKKVSLPETLGSLGNAAFSGCTSLETVSLPDSLTSVGESVFENCKSLKSINLPIGMSEIPRFFFLGNASLESIELPKGMSEIQRESFSGCTSLKTLTLPKGIYSLSDEAFIRCGLTDLYIYNPLLRIDYSLSSYYIAPFGDPEKVTVHAYAGTEAAELAQEMGYRFEPLPTK